MNNRFKRYFFGIIFLTFLIAVLVFSFKQTGKRVNVKEKAAENSINSAPRGIEGDLWADIEVGRRDFTEFSPNEIVPHKLFNPEGVITDNSVPAGRLYVWDSGNSRIVGIDLARCNNQNPPCTADIIIGQPSGYDYGACNQDASFQTYPNRPPSSASTLCGISEQTPTVLEDGTAVNMYVDDSGNLFVPDALNNRVLKYIKPFETDTVADEVWGQSDFSGNRCNIVGETYGGAAPTASSLCYCSLGSCGMGVTLDNAGNLWVADGGNNRVLRFPKKISTGQISKNADLVLGQPNFLTGGDWSAGTAMNKMNRPVAVSFDNNGILYVADYQNKRILVFNPPFFSGMSATGLFGSGFDDGPNNVKIDNDPDSSTGQVVLTSENASSGYTIKMWNLDGTLRKTLPSGSRGSGSIGIDNQNNIYYSSSGYGQDVFIISKKPDGNYEINKRLFSPPSGYNQKSAKRFSTNAWVGVTTAANQLIVGEGRLLFWNNLNSLTNGKTPDGYIDTSSPTEVPSWPDIFTQVKSDNQDRIWTIRNSVIKVYQAPLIIGSQPIKVIRSPIPVLGGGEIKPIDVLGITPTSDGNFLWVSEPGNHRVFRIRDPLTNPMVDIILGQTKVANNTSPDNGFDPAHTGDANHPNMCNRDEVLPPNKRTDPNQIASLDMLCFPGAISLDKKGNLYISDHVIESAGNWRLLMFSLSLFPANNNQVIFALPATKSFPNPHMTFEPAFDSSNRMVIGNNPYVNRRFLDYYNDPTRVNLSNPSDPNYAIPDGQLKDFYGWPIAAAFDSNDNLYIYDANRGKVMIYKKPFGANPDVLTPTPTRTPTPTNTPTPNSQVFNLRTMVVGMNPVENGKDLVSEMWGNRGKSAEQIEDEIVNMTINDIKSLSNNTINYEIVKKIRFDQFPPYTNGFQYNFDTYRPCVQEAGNPTGICETQKKLFDHVKWVTDNRICEIAEENNIDEIWAIFPTFLTTWENFMIGPDEGFYINGYDYILPQCKKHIIFTTGNYHEIKPLTHVYGHRIESTMSYEITDYWKTEDKNKYWFNFWDRKATAYCGSVHFPSNTSVAYDYSNTTYKDSSCLDWKNFPNFQGLKENINCNAWGCDDAGWEKFWMGSLPRSSGEISMISNSNVPFSLKKNWWYYLLYPENVLYLKKIMTGEIIPTPTASMTPTPNPLSNLTFNIKLEGITSSGKTKKVRVIIKNGSTEIKRFENISIISSSGGIFQGRVTDISTGTYDVYIKGEAHLQKKFTNIILTAGENTKDWSTTELQAGDFDNNNILNFTDISNLLGKYTAVSVPVADTNRLFDVNADNVISMNDITLVLSNFIALSVGGD